LVLELIKLITSVKISLYSKDETNGPKPVIFNQKSDSSTKLIQDKLAF